MEKFTSVYDRWQSRELTAPSGRFFATASSDGSTRLWDTSMGTLAGVLWSHRGPVKALAFTPDGQQLATGGVDRSARLWDMRQQPRTVRSRDDGGLRRADFSHDGSAFVTISARGAAQLWRTDGLSGVEQHPISGQHFTAIAFSPNGKLIATGARDGRIELRETAAGPALSHIDAGAKVDALVFSPDGAHLAAATDDGQVLVFDVNGAARLTMRSSLPIKASAMRFSGDGNRLITGAFDQTVRIWDWRHAAELRQIRASGDPSRSRREHGCETSGALPGARNVSMLTFSIRRATERRHSNPHNGHDRR